VQIPALRPAQLLQLSKECRDAGLGELIIGTRDHADAAHSLGLLRAHIQRPRCRASQERDESASSHATPLTTMMGPDYQMVSHVALLQLLRRNRCTLPWVA